MTMSRVLGFFIALPAVGLASQPVPWQLALIGPVAVVLAFRLGRWLIRREPAGWFNFVWGTDRALRVITLGLVVAAIRAGFDRYAVSVAVWLVLAACTHLTSLIMGGVRRGFQQVLIKHLEDTLGPNWAG